MRSGRQGNVAGGFSSWTVWGRSGGFSGSVFLNRLGPWVTVLAIAVLLAGAGPSGCSETDRSGPAISPSEPATAESAGTPEPQGSSTALPTTPPAPGQPGPASPGDDRWAQLGRALSAFNRGVGLLEQYHYSEAVAAFDEALAIAPGWSAARFNQGLAYLNMQESAGARDNLDRAQQVLEAILTDEPEHLHARFCLGLLHQHLGRTEQAAACFEAVHKADPTDPYVTYKLAEVLLALDRAEEGLNLLEAVVEQDPGFISGVYRLALQYRRTRQMDRAAALLKRFAALKKAELAGGTFTVLQTYGTVGKYYRALGADALPLPARDTTVRPIVFSPDVQDIGPPLAAWACAGGHVRMPGLAAGDIDGDGDLDLCVTGLGDDGAAAILANDGQGHFSQRPLPVRGAISPSFGDVDNDGDLDLWLGCAGPDRYFENDGKGNLTRTAGPDVAGPDVITTATRLLDIDSDGDLDLLGFRMRQGSVPVGRTFEPAASVVYNNNRDGTFADIAERLGVRWADRAVAAAVADDFDGDRDLDVIAFFAGDAPPIAWVNDRAWAHHVRDAQALGIEIPPAAGVSGATTGDPDADRNRDLLVCAGDGLRLYRNDGRFAFGLDETFSNGLGRIGGTVAQFADMDNDGDLDIVVADARRPDGTLGPTVLVNQGADRGFRDLLDLDRGNLLAAIQVPRPAACVAADFTGDGRCDIVLAAMGQRPQLLVNAATGGHWIELDLVGTRGRDRKSRSNNSGIGARVEIQAGPIFQQYVVPASLSATCAGPLRVHAGLGEQTAADWVRIVWPDGVTQVEIDLAADRVHTIEEVQRKTSSCPHLFAWDGRRFAFVSDFGGMGGVGYLVAPGTYGRPDPTEYVPIPHLEPRRGRYVLQVVEPLEETVFFDQAALLAVDHPADTEVWPNEMMAINADPPAFELFCYRQTIEPIRATDHHGQDVTDTLRTIDRHYAGATQIDPRFTGYAERHWVDLDFGDALAALDPTRRIVLFLHGWVEYPYSATNFAAAQAGVSLEAPTIRVWRDGRWMTLFEQVGYPAGLQHMMTLEMTGRLQPGDRVLRIESTMELFWDRIFLAPVLGPDVLNVRRLPVDRADLHFLGYPREYSPDGRLPNLLDYDNIDRAVPFKAMPGAYTRYGRVDGLLDAVDDCFVIMGRGEELTLEFDAAALPPVSSGQRRTFILETDSFCKDMDLYSAWPETVEPLPFHAMTGYPYGPDEHYPDTETHRGYRQEYNTRIIGPTP